jgi:cell division protein FtsL
MSKGKNSKLAILVFIGLAVYFSYTFISQEAVLDRKNNEMKTIEAKITGENKQNETLKKQKDTMNSDEYIEKIAREKLGMVKPGERVFVDVNK